MKRKEFLGFVIGFLLFGVLAVGLAGCDAKQATQPAPQVELASMPQTQFRDIIVQNEADVNGYLRVAGPTAMATDVPAAIVSNKGVGLPFEVRNASGTPVAYIGSDGAATFAGTIASAGNTTVAGTLGVTGNATFSGLILTTKQSNVTVTDDSTILATRSYVPLTAAGAVGTSDITVLTAGTWIYLTNVGSNTITITDTGTLKLAGDAALGQYDSLTLVSDGTNWIELARSNN